MARSRLDLSLEYQQCRTWGHAWEDYIPGPDEKKRPRWGHRFSLRCMRCATTRHDTIDTLGELSNRHYDYPGDYQYTIDEKPTIQTLRLSLSNELKEANAARTNGKRRRRAVPKKTRRLVAVS